LSDTRTLDTELVALAARCSRNSVDFVRVAFPWGRGELAGHDGPDAWQREVLEDIDRGLLTPEQAVREAIASGHGVGKSCLVSWIVLWALVTVEDTRGIVTANTESQLRQKTWAELAKWFRLCLWRDWFTLSATALHAADAEHEKTWRIDAVAWSERNTESFAGLHNQGKRILVVFDEASSIPDVIWETTEGALTDRDTEILWLVCGNPTRNTGGFRECFGRWKHRWIGRQVDSRTVRISNKAQIAQWVSDHGEDSDFVRVRVRGVFPRAGSQQFIGSDLVEAAAKREVGALLSDPLVMGVDVARFGDDQSVIFFRKGRDARIIPPICMREVDTMQLAARIADEAARYRVDAIFIDGGGVGGGVVDRCRQLRVPGVVEVQFGGKADRAALDGEGVRTRNKRAEMWAMMRAWLAVGGIPDRPDLIADLTGVEYGYDPDNAIVLETKADMKRRGLASPDLGDALALTFAYPVAAARLPAWPDMYGRKREFDPHALEWIER
jgi:hypothetical protein